MMRELQERMPLSLMHLFQLLADDVEAVRRDRNKVMNMGEYLRVVRVCRGKRHESVCSVCLAGALLIGRFQFPYWMLRDWRRGYHGMPDNMDDRLEDLLLAVDQFRLGRMLDLFALFIPDGARRRDLMNDFRIMFPRRYQTRYLGRLGRNEIMRLERYLRAAADWARENNV